MDAGVVKRGQILVAGVGGEADVGVVLPQLPEAAGFERGGVDQVHGSAASMALSWSAITSRITMARRCWMISTSRRCCRSVLNEPERSGSSA